MEYDIVIIGGGVSGLTAAMYAGRSGMSTMLIEESYIGGITATLDNVENFPGIPNMNGMNFVTSLYGQALNANANIQIATINKIQFDENIVSTTMGEVSYKVLIIATGSSYKKLNVKGESEYLGKGVSYCAVCDGSLYKNKKIVVVTNGNSAKSSIEYLSNITNNIVVVDTSNNYHNDNYKVYSNSIVKNIYGDDNVKGITISNENNEINLHCDGVFVDIGKFAKTDIFKECIDINNGHIVTNDSLQTNINNVFAVGDIREKSKKQIVTACADGAIAVLNAIKLIKK